MPEQHSLRTSSWQWVWGSALVLFLVAAATGAFFRYGMVYGRPAGLDLSNIRHAHSHLMYFGWVTPVLMVLIWKGLPDQQTRPYDSFFRWMIGAVLAFAVLSYPLFLFYGYAPVQLGARTLPIAVIGASLNMLAWYGFAALYWSTTHGRSRSAAWHLWDVSVIALVCSTVGAWLLALAGPLGLHDPFWRRLLTHVFLDLFSEGWLVAGLLGTAYALCSAPAHPTFKWGMGSFILGLPGSVLVSLPTSQLAGWAYLIGSVSSVLVGLGLILLLVPLLYSTQARTWMWGLPLALIALKATAQGINGLWPEIWLGELHGMRVLYLHLMLLGGVTLGCTAAARMVWTRAATPAIPLLYATVLLVIGTLIPLSEWSPAHGRWALELAFWAALAPVVVTTWMVTSRGVWQGPDS